MQDNRLKKNQFFIITALQLINAVEYIHQSGKQDEYNELILVTIGHKVKSELMTIIDIYKWSAVIHLFPEWMLKIKYFSVRTPIMNIWAKYRLDRIFSPQSVLIFGHERNLYCRYIAKKSKTSIQVLLDDGAGSLAFNKDAPVHISGKVSVALEKYFGVKDYLVHPHYFFTAYKEKLINTDMGKINLIMNDFSFLKDLARHRKIGKSVYFIGDPLVERNVISEDAYFRQIEEIKAIYGSNLFYVPRSTEDQQKVERISKIVPIIRPGVPFEVFLVSNEILPFKLIGYHTSVLFNTHKIFGNAIELYHIKLKEFKREIYKEILPKVYKELDLISKEWPAAV